MAYPAWFIPAYYAGQKVEQMTDIRYLGRDDWTEDSYLAELENFRDANGQPLAGETVEDKAYTNFLACNGANYDAYIPRSAINVSPNEYFNVAVYLQNLADYSNLHDSADAPEGGWTMESMLQHLNSRLHMSAWEHYTTVGMFADIDPSNAFSTRTYMNERVKAMNSFENSDGSLGWGGKDNWTLAEAQQYLANAGLNPIMDLYGSGGRVFELTATAPARQTETPADWNPWQTPQPHNPYDDVEAIVEMTAAQTAYSGQNGVNTRYEAVWNNATEESTIANTDIIQGGANAYNTLAVKLDAPWPGFRGQNGPNVTNIGCLDLAHGDVSPATPYTFDARNIQGVERIDINDNGSGAISLKNLAASVEQVNIHGLSPIAAAGTGSDAGTQAAAVTQTTSIEFVTGAVSGSNNSLSLGVENTGAEDAPAGVKMQGIENLAVNALSGASVLSLQNAAGVRNLKIEGDGNIKITNVANGIQSYDASTSTGIVNMAASDLRPGVPVLGGQGMTTLTLTQNFTGLPVNWSGIDALAINPGVQAAVQGVNVKGLSSLWVNTGQNVSLTDLPVTTAFNVRETFADSHADIKVMGGIQNLDVSNADYAAAEGAVTYAKLFSDAANNVNITATGQGNLGGSFTFSKAAGYVALGVEDGAAFSGSVTAANAHDFQANISGDLADGAKFNVVDSSALNGSVSIAAGNGVSSNGSAHHITLDSDGASKVAISSGGDFGLAKGSSLSAAQDITITLDGTDANFDSSRVKMPQAHNVIVNGGDVTLGDLGSNALRGAMELVVNNAESFAAGKMETGSNGNIIANITANDSVTISGISAGGTGNARGDVHLTVDAASIEGNSTVSVAGADIFINLSGVDGNAFDEVQAALQAAESINFIGAQGTDNIKVDHVGTRGPSHIDLGDGADYLRIGDYAVDSGQNVRIDVDFGDDSFSDILDARTQRAGAKLGVYVDDFVEGTDKILFDASNRLTVSQAHNLLASFGVADIPVTNNMIVNFGTGNGVLYDGDLYGFNASSNATTMVVLTGVNGGVGNLSGQVSQPDADGNDLAEA